MFLSKTAEWPNILANRTKFTIFVTIAGMFLLTFSLYQSRSSFFSKTCFAGKPIHLSVDLLIFECYSNWTQCLYFVLCIGQ